MSLEKMIAYVQIYIHIRKNVEIEISINGTRDLFLLQRAYQSAVTWMEENNCKLTIVL